MWFAYARLLLLPLPLRRDPVFQAALDEEEVDLRLDGGVDLVARELEEGTRARRQPRAITAREQIEPFVVVELQSRELERVAIRPHGGGHDRGVGTERFGRVPERISRS